MELHWVINNTVYYDKPYKMIIINWASETSDLTISPLHITWQNVAF